MANQNLCHKESPPQIQSTIMAFLDLSDVNWFAVAVWVVIFAFSLLTLLAPPAKKVRELRPLKSEGKPEVKPAVVANITPAPVAPSTPAPTPKLPVVAEPSKEAKQIEQKDLTLSEVAKHNKRDDCWIIVEGLVYDVTKYIPLHPGECLMFLIVIDLFSYFNSVFRRC